jgi:hypothetical protein
MSYDHLYKEADKVLVLHEEDQDLDTIHIPLPSPPAKEKIDGYGKHPSEQFFVHEEMPERLKHIETYIRRFYAIKEKDPVIIDQIYDYLESQRKDWTEEIKWIRKMIHRRYHGCWIYINGKPTYINRWYWFFLNQWDVGNTYRTDGRPEYRERDWMWWTANQYLYETTSVPWRFRVDYVEKGKKRTKYFGFMPDAKVFTKSLESRNKMLYETKGQIQYYNINYEEGLFLQDVGRRVNYGLTYPKGRRDGATYRSQSNGYCIITEGKKRFGGIQSKSDADSEGVFSNKLIKPWQSTWFFFKPSHDGGSTPKSKLDLVKSSRKKNELFADTGLNGWIDFRNSNTLAYDGEKLHFIHHDEVGKKEKGSTVDVIKRWNVARKCLQQGAGRDIIGWALLTSTTDKMAGGGGRDFYHICKNSNYLSRNANGQTLSGLVNLFIPSHIGLEGFVDKFGNTVIETPEEPVMGANGKPIDIGSLDHIMNTRKSLEESEDFEALNEEIRQHPIKFAECFREDSSESGFNTAILNERIQYLKFNEPPMRYFDLEWENGTFGPVVLVDNPEGKFKASWLPEKQHCNNMVYDVEYGWYAPGISSGLILGCDPFMFNKTRGNVKSNGAGALFRVRDKRLDPDSKEPYKWVTNKFAVTYNTRVNDKDEYAQDMLKLCIYTGAMAYPENNVPLIDEKFKEWGYGGYLLYKVDDFGREQVMAGENTNNISKQLLFGEWMTYINRYASNEDHIEMLQECLEIGSIENMTYYDLFTAGGWALRGASMLGKYYVDESQKSTDISDIFQTYSY